MTTVQFVTATDWVGDGLAVGSMSLLIGCFLCTLDAWALFVCVRGVHR